MLTKNLELNNFPIKVPLSAKIIIKKTPKTGINVYTDGKGVCSLKKKIENKIKEIPVIERKLFPTIFFFKIKNAAIEPTNISQARLGAR